MKYLKPVLLLFLLLANVFVFREVLSLSRGLEVVFFDVGQGDCLFIETEEGHQVLIDGGPDQRLILEKLGRQMPFWDKTLDLVVLTHPDYDHLNGLLAVLENYKVENILWLGAGKENKSNQKWQELLAEEGAGIFIATKGKTIKAGKAIFYVLHPFVSPSPALLEKQSNENSIVLKLVFGESEFLFTGDISQKQEEELLITGDLPVGLQSDVLKIPHHGSKIANSQEFIEVVSPEVAIISCGKDNSYGHPHQEVLSVLEQSGKLEHKAIRIKRTDLQGDIKIVSDGFNLIY